MTLPVFSYKAALPSGEVSEGSMQAANRDEVIRFIQSQGKIPIRADEQVTREAPQYKSSFRFLNRVSDSDIASLSVELATLLNAGMSLDKSLQMLADATDKAELHQVLISVHDAVTAGESLSAALSQHHDVFNDYFINMVKAGESGGVLAPTLMQLGESMEHARQIRESIVSKMVYPLILLFVAAMSIIVLLTYVIPQFEQLFDEANAQLPLLTRIVLGIGHVAGNYGIYLVLLVAALLFVVRQQYQGEHGRLLWDSRLLVLPVVSDLIIKLEVARFSHALSTLLTNGVPLLDAARISTALVSNRAVCRDLENLLPSLEAGEGMHKPLTHSRLMPTLLANMVHVGEESGQLSDMLRRVADIYEREVDKALARLLILVEPVLIISLGVIISGIIFSILAAILGANELVF